MLHLVETIYLLRVQVLVQVVVLVQVLVLAQVVVFVNVVVLVHSSLLGCLETQLPLSLLWFHQIENCSPRNCRPHRESSAAVCSTWKDAATSVGARIPTMPSFFSFFLRWASVGFKYNCLITMKLTCLPWSTKSCLTNINIPQNFSINSIHFDKDTINPY